MICDLLIELPFVTLQKKTSTPPSGGCGIPCVPILNSTLSGIEPTMSTRSLSLSAGRTSTTEKETFEQVEASSIGPIMITIPCATQAEAEVV